MTPFLLVVLPALLAVAGLLFYLARRSRRAIGLPIGRIVYGDTADWNRVDKPLRSRRYGLVGKPDYLVETVANGRRCVIPVEVKSRSQPKTPYSGHVLQLGAYCLLVEDCYRLRPPIGLLRYANETFEIPFTDDLRRAVLAAAADIRAARTAGDIARDHDEAARCRNCGYLAACGAEALMTFEEQGR